MPPKVLFSHLKTALSSLLTRETMPPAVSLDSDTTSLWATSFRESTLTNSISQEPWLHLLKVLQVSNLLSMVATSTTLPLEWDSTSSRVLTPMNKPWANSSTSHSGTSSINQACRMLTINSEFNWNSKVIWDHAKLSCGEVRNITLLRLNWSTKVGNHGEFSCATKTVSHFKCSTWKPQLVPNLSPTHTSARLETNTLSAWCCHLRVIQKKRILESLST